MLFKIVLFLESFTAHFTRECHIIFMGTLVYHQVVGFGEAALAILTDKLTLGSHLAPSELPPLVSLHLHYCKHLHSLSLTLFLPLCVCVGRIFGPLSFSMCMYVWMCESVCVCVSVWRLWGEFFKLLWPLLFSCKSSLLFPWTFIYSKVSLLSNLFQLLFCCIYFLGSLSLKSLLFG